MICPICQKNYVEGMESCPDCVVSLIWEDLHDFEAGSAAEGDLAVLLTVNEPSRLAAAEAALEAAGIPLMVEPTAAAGNGSTIWVPESRIEAARRVLAGETGGGEIATEQETE